MNELNFLKRVVPAVLLSGVMLFTSLPAYAATQVTAGQNTVEQGTVVWFNSSDRRGDSTSEDSDISRIFAQEQEKVDNANSAINTNMDEIYQLMGQYGGLKNPGNALENGGAASSTNTLSDEEFTELAHRLGLDSNPFGDAVQNSTPNMQIIEIIKEIIKDSGSMSDILENDDGSQKTANDFFPEDYRDQAFQELCDRLGVDPETFLQEQTGAMWDRYESTTDQLMQDLLAEFRKKRLQMYQDYLVNKDAMDDAAREAMEELEKQFSITTGTNGDILQVTEESWKDNVFYRQADIVYTCSVCGFQYGWADGRSLQCACGKHLDNTPREHFFESSGLDESDANDQFKRCQYCKKEITAQNAEGFYYQTQESAAQNGTGTFALICSDCANYDGIFFYIPNYDDYTTGHGDAFLTIGQMSAEEFEGCKDIEDPADPWYVKEDGDGRLYFPNQSIDRMYISTPEEALGELTPYIQVVDPNTDRPTPDVDVPDLGNGGIDTDGDGIVDDFLDDAIDEGDRVDTDDSLQDLIDLLIEYDDTGYFEEIYLEPPESWNEEEFEEVFKNSVETITETVIEYQQTVIDADEENDAFDRIKDTGKVDGIMSWNDRLTAIFGEWPSNYELWTDEQKALYEQFMQQYQNADAQEIIEDMMGQGIFDEEDQDVLLEALQEYQDGYTDIEDSVVVNLVVDSTEGEGRNTVYEAETMIASSYQIVVNGVVKSEMPWTGGYASLRCSNLGTYVIRRTCELVRTTIFTGTTNQTIRWTATKGGQTVTLYEKTNTYAYCNTYSQNISAGKERMADIIVHVVAGDQVDLSVPSGFTSERVY